MAGSKRAATRSRGPRGPQHGKHDSFEGCRLSSALEIFHDVLVPNPLRESDSAIFNPPNSGGTWYAFQITILCGEKHKLVVISTISRQHLSFVRPLAEMNTDEMRCCTRTFAVRVEDDGLRREAVVGSDGSKAE